jgi:flagellin
VAQNVRSSVSSLTSANQQLGNATGLLNSTSASLTQISSYLNTIKTTLGALSGTDVTGTTRSNDVSQVTSLLSQIKTTIANSGYDGASLIGDTTAAKANSTYISSGVSVQENDTGNVLTLTSFSGSSLVVSITNTALLGSSATSTTSAASFAALLTKGGTFTTAFNSVSSALNTYGNLTNLVTNQISFNTAKITSLNNGVGALVDANEAQESASLQALQVQQQLATSALSIAEQTPSLLTKLIQ